MEDVVASTVDAVREEQEIHQEKVRKYIEKLRRQKRRAGVKRKEPSPKPPLPEADSEPSPGEAAARAKRRWKECRGSLRSSLAVLILLWAPWVLVQAGVEVPFFSESVDNAALCVLVPQALISVLCWPVYRAALEGLREGAWTISATAAMVTLVTLLDEMTMLLLPLRTEAAPLGGVAAALCVFALWGLASHARGAYESFRTAAMGTPTCLVDCCKQGIAKGSGSVRGFYTRLNMEDVSAQWQRLLLPVLAAASLVFGALSSAGQGRMQDLLWCCSVVLCFSSALVFPLAFSVPFGRLAAQLSRSGAAVAGQYGARIWPPPGASWSPTGTSSPWGAWASTTSSSTARSRTTPSPMPPPWPSPPGGPWAGSSRASAAVPASGGRTWSTSTSTSTVASAA